MFGLLRKELPHICECIYYTYTHNILSSSKWYMVGWTTMNPFVFVFLSCNPRRGFPTTTTYLGSFYFPSFVCKYSDVFALHWVPVWNEYILCLFYSSLLSAILVVILIIIILPSFLCHLSSCFIFPYTASW